MAGTYTDALHAFARKRNVPTELLTEDWSALDTWIRERAFWMAGVTDARILQQFRREIELMADGGSSGAESMNRMMLYLERVGYRPPEGQEGTIKDLSSWKRMSVALDTNVAIMRGYGLWARAQQSLRVFPAWELIRVAPRVHVRDWETRWAMAHAATREIPGASLAPRVALVNHPVWIAISAFGNPYPPFDWGSGMGVRAVARSKAAELGLLTDATRPLWEKPIVVSPNANLSLKPELTSQELRDALSERLKGLAEWDGDILRHTDPNGTRPMTASRIADVWKQGLPDGIPARQQDAFTAWLRDAQSIRPGSDAWFDLTRLAQRLVNEAPAAGLWRGMAMSETAVDDFIRAISDRYTVGAAAESWTADLAAAMQSAAWHDSGQWSVLVTVENPAAAKDIGALVKSAADALGTAAGESSWLYRAGQSFRVLRIERNAEARQVTVTLVES